MTKDMELAKSPGVGAQLAPPPQGSDGASNNDAKPTTAPKQQAPLGKDDSAAAPSTANSKGAPSEISPPSVSSFDDGEEVQLLPPTAAACCSRQCWFQLGRFVGPGFLIAMAYIDPGNLAADINQGVAAGYTLAWVTLWSTVIGYFIQCLAAKLGVATERTLAQHCRANYPPFPRYTLMAATELGIIACDMIEVIGGASALSTLSSGRVPIWAGVLITATASFAALGLERWGMRLLEAFLFTMIMVMAGMFSYLFFSTGVDYGATAKGLAVPTLSSQTISYAVSTIGAIIMPHNLYLHSALVLTRRELVHTTSTQQAMRYVRLEAAIALFIALIINIFVISVFANAFYGKPEGDSVGIGNAGVQLSALYGPAMRYVWGIGLFAAANASTVTSTFAGQVVLVGYLKVNASRWWSAAAVRLVSLGPTLLLAVFLKGENASFSTLTEWLNIVQSLVLPFVVIPLIFFTSSKKIMGEHANKRWVVVVMGLILAALVGLNGYVAGSFGLDQLPKAAWAWALFGIACALYIMFVAYLLLGPSRVDGWVVNGAKKVASCSKEVCSKPVVKRAVDMVEGF